MTKAPYFVVRSSPLRLLVSPVIWSVHFLAVYVITALVAAGDINISDAAARTVLLTLTGVAAVAIGFLVVLSILKTYRTGQVAPLDETAEPKHPKSVGTRTRQVAAAWAVIDGVSLVALIMVSAPIAALPI